MVSVLVDDLPAATSEFLHRRSRRSGAPSVAEHVRHELITMAREHDPVDHVVRFQLENYTHPPRPTVDPDAVAMAEGYRLPHDVWDTLCRRAAASDVAVSDYVHGELSRLARHPTIEDSMWELSELQAANPDLDVDFDEVHRAMRYARGL